MRATPTKKRISILCVFTIGFGCIPASLTCAQTRSTVVAAVSNAETSRGDVRSLEANPEDRRQAVVTLVNASNRHVDDSREARARALGTLMLCGGGPLPESLLQMFFELGQAKQGSLVIIPSASSMADLGDFGQTVVQWQQFPWASVQVLHAKNRQDIDRDDFVKPLQNATAVWISGGDQRRLAERYLGTQVESELKDVVKRGGIIGGTSAGSAIASRVMISGGRETPQIANGLDLLPGTIIDQHFTQRRRHGRLVSAVQQHPDRLGIGIDESTGLVVSKSEARVVGNGAVYVYATRPPMSEPFEPLRFESGTAFEFPEFHARNDN